MKACLLMALVLVACRREEPPKEPSTSSKDVTWQRLEPEGPPQQVPAALPHDIDAHVVLLMPEADLAARVDVSPLSHGLKAIMNEMASLYASRDIPAVPLALYVAAKPGKGIKTWAVGLDGALTQHDAELLEKKTSAVQFPPVRGAIAVSIVYARKGQEPQPDHLPLPRSWIEAAGPGGKPLWIPDALFAKVWPD